ncbi:MAG: DUF4136 domain-containing protein [Thermoanaerobaculaceae bacterium]|jgi:hypothetical protein|nr:DUF4136 domain-containing protein [Thermoanaerobaculaceae bacterium]
MPVNRSLALVSVALLSAGLLACSTAKVAATYDPSVDFSQYRTFGYRTDRKLDDPYRQAAANKIITECLTRKGFRLDAASPDVLIGLYPDITQDIEKGYVPAGTVVWTTWGPYDGLNLAAAGRDLREAGFAITMRDARDNRLLWRGIAHGTAVVGDKATNLKRGRAAIEELLRGFPPQTKQTK